MNRLQKKCFIVSVGVHLLLAVILVVGPGFLAAKNKVEDLPVIDFIPSQFIDAPFVGGGNRNAKPPVAAALAPQPPPQKPPDRQPQLDSPKVNARNQKPEPDSFEEPKRHSPQISTTLINRKTNSKR